MGDISAAEAGRELVADDAAQEAGKLGAKVGRHDWHIAIQLAEVTIPRQPFAEILRLGVRVRPRTAPA